MNRRLLAFLAAGMLLAGSAEAATRFTIRHAGTLHHIDFTDEGRAEAEGILRRAFGSRYRSSKSYLLTQRIFDPTVRAEMERAASLDGGGDYHVVLTPADSPNQIFPGESLNLPDGSSYTVRSGDTLGRIASRNGVSYEELLEANEGRFDIWPNASTHTGDDGTTIRVVSFGETHMATHHYDQAQIDEVLIHEASHVGDGSECSSSPHQQYGHDHEHRGDEILSPRSAFTEGWAVYRGLAGGGETNHRSAIVDPATPLPTLTLETGDGEYTEVKCWDLTVHDVLSNERQVARVLYRMATDLTPGEEGVTRAFLDTQGTGCRTLPDLVEAYVDRNPDQAEAVRNLLQEVWGGLVSTAQAADIVAGRIPKVDGSRIGATDYGRTPPYTATERADGEECDVMTFDEIIIGGGSDEGGASDESSSTIFGL